MVFLNYDISKIVNYRFYLGGKSSSELDSISDISLSDHELQLKEVLISSEFNQDFINNYDDDVQRVNPWVTE